MLAVASDMCTVSVVDTSGKKVVRRFKGHTNRITDMVSTVSIFSVKNNIVLAVFVYIMQC